MTARAREHRRKNVHGVLPWGAPASQPPGLAELLGPLTWQDRAACRDVGGDAWFPEGGQPATGPKTICRRCPVRTECLWGAIDRGEQHGIWAASR